MALKCQKGPVDRLFAGLAKTNACWRPASGVGESFFAILPKTISTTSLGEKSGEGVLSKLQLNDDIPRVRNTNQRMIDLQGFFYDMGVKYREAIPHCRRLHNRRLLWVESEVHPRTP